MAVDVSEAPRIHQHLWWERKTLQFNRLHDGCEASEADVARSFPGTCKEAVVGKLSEREIEVLTAWLRGRRWREPMHDNSIHVGEQIAGNPIRGQCNTNASHSVIGCR